MTLKGLSSSIMDALTGASRTLEAVLRDVMPVTHTADAWLELYEPSRGAPATVELSSESMTIGKADDNDVSVPSDPKVSRLHAKLVRYAAGWCISDLGSANGTIVRSVGRGGVGPDERVLGERRLRSGDVVRLSDRTWFVFRSNEAANVTEAAPAPPELTPAERRVLVELCRPHLAGDIFSTPSSNEEIAATLYVSESAVKQHVTHLCEKFGIDADPTDRSRRRIRLASAALARGAVRLCDLTPG